MRLGSRGNKYTKHGLSDTPEYAVWVGMLNRCRNPKVSCFKDYGDRGITVDQRWSDSFENFYADVGRRPSPEHSLERIENNGNYEPGNVCWATTLEQSNNKRNTRYVTYKGQRMALNDAVRAAGSVVHYEAAWTRITRCGWKVEHALEIPRLMESPNSKRRRNSSPRRRAA